MSSEFIRRKHAALLTGGEDTAAGLPFRDRDLTGGNGGADSVLVGIAAFARNVPMVCPGAIFGHIRLPSSPTNILFYRDNPARR